MAVRDEDLDRSVASALLSPAFWQKMLTVLERQDDPATRTMLIEALKDLLHTLQEPPAEG